MSTTHVPPHQWNQTYTPKGIRFYDWVSKRQMMLVSEGPWFGWICWQHPDGQWVTLRKATDKDKAAIQKAVADGSAEQV